jgi:fatty-acyl-CoA synthase
MTGLTHIGAAPAGPALTNHSGLTVSGQALTALRRFPDRVAFSWDGGALRYDATLDLIGRIQAVLVRRNLPVGGVVAILSDNSAESWCANIAAQALGLGVTWLHPKGSVADMIFQIRDCEAVCVIIDAVGHAKRADAIAADLSPEVVLLAIGAGDFAPDLIAAAHDHGSATARNLATADGLSMIHYTGGTTGQSKGAVRSHRTAAAFLVYTPLSDWELPARPRYLGIAPNSHAAGTFIIPTLIRGGQLHLERSFDVEKVLSVIERERINCTFVVPSQIYAMLGSPTLDGADLTSLELVMYGAAPMSPTRLEEALDRMGPVFSQGYGQTECLPVTSLKREDHDPARPDLLASCGFPVSSAEVRLLDDDGQEVAPGEAGEICIRSPAALDRYHNRPEQTAETLAGGWLHSGDIARKDERGYLTIIDRKKDLIISGGFNVYSREVEDALGSHEAVSVCAVIGMPDEKWGERVTAFVILRPEAAASSEALIAHVKALKGSVQAPKQVEFVSELPLTPLGKIDKKRLRASLKPA